MKENNLRDLLKKYEQKRITAETKLENKKNKLYSENPTLDEIDNKINKLFFKKSKNILLNEFPDSSIDKEIESLQNQKEIILKKLNLDKNYFVPEYECKLCNDTGYITNDDGTSSMCSCLKQELININYNKSNIGNLEKENFKNFDLSLFSDEVNTKKYNSKISPRENMKNIKNLSLTFIKNFDNPDEKNLLFSGNTGVRKNIFNKLYCKRNFRKKENCFISNSAKYDG